MLITANKTNIDRWAIMQRRIKRANIKKLPNPENVPENNKKRHNKQNVTNIIGNDRYSNKPTFAKNWPNL